MKNIAFGLAAALLTATSVAAMGAKDADARIVHSDPGEIRISVGNDSR